MDAELVLTPENIFFKRFLAEFNIKRNVVSTFDNWLDNGIKNQLNERLSYLVSQPDGKFSVDALEIREPESSLNLYRDRNGKYIGNVFIKVKFTPANKSPPSTTDFFKIGGIPIMLGSKYCKLYDHEKSKEDGFPQVLPPSELIKLGECPNDSFGYFFIKGEKTIIIQEKLRVCSFLTYAADNKGTIESRITCVNSVNSTIVTVNIDPKLGSIVVGLNHLRKKKYPLFVIFKILDIEYDKAIKLILFFIRVENRRKADFKLMNSFEHYKQNRDDIYLSIANLREFKGESEERNAKIEEDIFKDLYSHIADRELKILSLAYHVSRMLEYQIGVRSLDSRDDWGNKRLDSAGRSMEQLVTVMWNSMVDLCQKELIGTKTDPLKKVKETLSHKEFTDDFIAAYGNSSWGLRNGRSQENIVEQLRRDTPLAVISQIGRVNAPVSRRGQMRNIREVRGEQCSYLCAFETTEGDGCGIIKNVAMTCWPSIERPTAKILGFISGSGLFKRWKIGDSILDWVLTENFLDMPNLLLLNGIIIGWCRGPELQKYLISMRRSSMVEFDICIHFNVKDRCLEIDTLGSRPTRPVLIVNEDGQLVIDTIADGWKLSIPDLRRLGCLENIDVREQHTYYFASTIEEVRERYSLEKKLIDIVGDKIDDFMMAKNDKDDNKLKVLIDSKGVVGLKKLVDEVAETWFQKRYDYAELDPNALFSLTISHIPRANQQQGPRTTYQGSMGKQALSQFHTCEGRKMYTSYKKMVFPSRPIMEVETAEGLGLNRMPAGKMITVGIMAHPDNPEDGIVMTEEAANLTHSFTICKKAVHTIIDKREDQFQQPSTQTDAKIGKYHAIEENGLPRLDSYLARGDCIIGRVHINKETGKTENNSIFVGIGEEGYVDRITINTNDADNNGRIIKIRLRQFRPYKTGDKLASRYAQKGTVACVVKKESMPRVCKYWIDKKGKSHESPNAGMVPDILINPHSFPSRMTMNKMVEMITSKAALFTGKRVNGTTFRELDMRYFKKILRDNGMRDDGTEDVELQTYMTHQTTREKIFTGNWRKTKIPILISCCYYQALRHHVDDKLQYRSRGAVRSVTHQPVRGRSREGGIRFGEMERDAQISHGAASILQERLCISSDQFTMPVCVTCGRLCIADYMREKVKYTCNVCNGKTFGIIKIPYAYKLIYFMLVAAGIDVQLELKSPVDEHPDNRFFI
jgi:DNA-directed RNA polymerase II subunit RPB2